MWKCQIMYIYLVLRFLKMDLLIIKLKLFCGKTFKSEPFDTVDEWT